MDAALILREKLGIKAELAIFYSKIETVEQDRNHNWL
jgi:hypothetical protein